MAAKNRKSMISNSSHNVQTSRSDKVLAPIHQEAVTEMNVEISGGQDEEVLEIPHEGVLEVRVRTTNVEAEEGTDVAGAALREIDAAEILQLHRTVIAAPIRTAEIAENATQKMKEEAQAQEPKVNQLLIQVRIQNRQKSRRRHTANR